MSQIVADAAVAKQLDPDAYQVYLVWLAAIISHEIIHLTRAYMVSLARTFFRRATLNE